MVTKTYSIHDLVRFEIVDRSPSYRRLIDKTRIQFENFETPQKNKLDFTVEIGSFSHDRQDCFVLDDTYFVDDGYFYCKDHRKFAQWQLEVCDLENQPKVKIDTNFAGYYTVPLNIIEFFIHYALLKKGRALIHASGVAKDGRCCLFSARGGGGKTTMALSLVDKGWTYLGDNFILLDEGRAFSFISPLNIFSYNRLGIVERNLTARQRTSMALKMLIHKLTANYIKIFEKINPVMMFPERIITASEVSHICILEPVHGLTGHIPSPEHIDHMTLVKKLRYNMEMDLGLFSKYMYSYGYMNPRSSWADFWGLYEEALTRNLPSKIPSSVVKVSTQYSPEAINDIMDKMAL